jgi:hypothetical protein
VRAAFQFQRLQPMRLALFDVDVRTNDNSKLKLDEQDFLGRRQGRVTGPVRIAKACHRRLLDGAAC